MNNIKDTFFCLLAPWLPTWSACRNFLTTVRVCWAIFLRCKDALPVSERYSLENVVTTRSNLDVWISTLNANMQDNRNYYVTISVEIKQLKASSTWLQSFLLHSFSFITKFRERRSDVIIYEGWSRQNVW